MRGYDVIVVGGRVAGASTAMLLARDGMRVALLDRSERGSDTLSTHALMRGGVLQLTRWGVLPDVVAAGTPAVRRTHFHYPDGHVEVDIRPRAGVDALYAPRRHLLDRLLVDAAEASGVHVRHGTTATSLLRDRDGRVCGLRALGPDRRQVELRARTTVGADGVRSMVAEQAGAATTWQGTTASAVLYRYLEDAPADGYEWAYGTGAGAGMIPTDDGATCVFVGTTPARMRRLRRSGAEQAFRELLVSAGPSLLGRVRAARPVSPMRGWAGVPGLVRRAGGPGWALVGDAGCFKDPITSHGITDALRDAELLATGLVRAHGGELPEEAALIEYQTTRDRLSGDLLAVTEDVAAYDWTPARIRTLLRSLSAAMEAEVEHLDGLHRPAAVTPT